MKLEELMRNRNRASVSGYSCPRDRVTPHPFRICFRPAALACAALALAAPAGTIVWTNTAGGVYSDVANWEPGQAPDADDLAELRANAAYTITLDRPATNHSLHVYDGQPTIDLAGFDYFLTNSIVKKDKTIGFYVEKGYLRITNSAATPAVFGSNDTIYASLYQPWNAPVGKVEFAGSNTIVRLRQIIVNNATSANTLRHELRIVGGAKVTTSLPNLTLTSGGDILVSDPGTVLSTSGMFLSAGGFTVVSNQAFVTVGTGSIEVGRPGRSYFYVTDPGTIVSAGNVVLATADTATYGLMVVTNGGTLTATNSSSSKIWGPNTNDRDCDMIVSGAGSAATTLDLYLSGSSRTTTFPNSPFRLLLNDGGLMRVTRYTTIWTNGLVRLDGGTLVNSTQGVVNRGLIEGRGRLERHDASGTVGWDNYGTIHPGLTNWAFGTLIFTNCNLTLWPSSRLEFEIGGTHEGEYSRVAVHGTAALDGACQVRLASGYEPKHADTFPLIDADSFSGAFTSFELPDIAPASWDIDELATTGVLRVYGPPRETIILVR